jgi:hypothetical protein
MRISRTFLAVTAILLVLATSIVYQHSQIPTLVEVAVKLRLFRGSNYGSGSLEGISLKLARDTRAIFDNVTLVPNQDHNDTSSVYWRVLIIANESASRNVEWRYEVHPSSDKVGTYAGVVSTLLDLKGTYTLWVMLYSIHGDSILNEESFSERIYVY